MSKEGSIFHKPYDIISDCPKSIGWDNYFQEAMAEYDVKPQIPVPTDYTLTTNYSCLI